MKTKLNLFLFTISFPNEEGEPFLANEFPYLSDSFERIHIITSSGKTNNITLPAHVTVHNIWEIIKGANRKKIFLSSLFLISRILIFEFFACRSKTFFLKNSRFYLNTIINSLICSDYIHKLQDFKRESVFYSFWMNNHALTLAVMKMQKRIDQFVFRVHGYDLILERWPHKYIAFQKTCHNYAEKIFTVSKKSLEYFNQTYSNSKKARVAYLGTIDNGTNPLPLNETVTLVSCSNIIPLKRLHLIIDILKKTSAKVIWIHFGEGYLKNEIIAQCKALPPNISVEFRGQVSQDELFNFYRSNPINYFINVSDSEGLPFTIIEAISFGIPVIATNVGGTSEIVTNDTGILLEENFNSESVICYFNNYKSLPYSTSSFRENVREFWKKNFFAGVVYPAFIQREFITGEII